MRIFIITKSLKNSGSKKNVPFTFPLNGSNFNFDTVGSYHFSSHPHNRKNSTTSLNSAQMSLLVQLQQHQNLPMQQQQSQHQSNSQNINSTSNLFNQSLFNNSPGQFNSNHLQQQHQQVNQQHYGSNGTYSFGS